MQPAREKPGDETLELAGSVRHLLEQKGVLEVLVCAITAIAYLGTIVFGFIYDDKPVIVDNTHIRSWHFLLSYLIPQFSTANAVSASATFYRPVTVLWLRLNYALFGLNPAGWHFAMVAGHVLMTYLVFVLVKRLTDHRITAAVAALLFGLHPVHVENVAWLSSVNDLLMSVLLVGSFLAYLKFREGGKLWMALSVLLFALALLSKETTAAFPLLIFAFAVIFARSHEGQQSKFWTALKAGTASIPYCLVLGLYLIGRRMILHSFAKPISPLSWTTMILTWPSVIWFDAKHLLFPTSSSEFYSLTYVTRISAQDVLLLGGLLVLFVAVGYWISKLPNARLGFFALLWVVVTTLPTLYLRAIAPQNFVHDRFLYLPSVGIVILVALAVEQISRLRLPTEAGGVVAKWAIVGILCIAAFAGTVSYQTQWANNILLYQNGIKSAPQNLIVQDNLANEMTGIGRYDLAIPLYLNVLKRDPHFWSSNYNVGYAYYRAGMYAHAEDYLKRAIQIDDQDPDEFIFLARAQMEQGKLDEANRSAELALQRGPLSPGFHFVRARILEASGERDQAITEYNAEVVNHPDNSLAKSELQRLQSPQ